MIFTEYKPFQNIIIAQIKPERKVEKGEGLQPPYLLHSGVYLFIYFIFLILRVHGGDAKAATERISKQNLLDRIIKWAPFPFVYQPNVIRKLSQSARDKPFLIKSINCSVKRDHSIFPHLFTSVGISTLHYILKEIYFPLSKENAYDRWKYLWFIELRKLYVTILRENKEPSV